ncbi:hypothetical protein LLEC1_04961 [Akanthomyces lecanii]|uniref:Uncharacterized protein n=1 Tax=Cordyceps confragosa TaxID=2714763 RepID=A0A179ITX1_CORDF|nr:hypothetical protein LLEC1_04961 [Akanthomyces lecanii]
MGYYAGDGRHYQYGYQSTHSEHGNFCSQANDHTFPHGIQNLADKIEYPVTPSNTDDSESSSWSEASENTHHVNPETTTILCHDVDIKVPGDSSIEEPKLHTLARRGHESVLVKFLERKTTKINELDKLGRTALFAAVEARLMGVVRLLVDANIDINAVDIQGETALSIAASNPESYPMVPLLLKRGALATQGTNPGVGKLLSATARGNIKQVSTLLGGNISVPGPGLPRRDDEGFRRVKATDSDKLGYTALHEAAFFGYYQIASLLINKTCEAKETRQAQEAQEAQEAKSQTSFLGETVLHAAIDSGGEHGRYLTDGRERARDLRDEHVRVVALLLRNGASAKHRRRDGKRAQDVVSAKLSSFGLKSTQKRILQQILVLLSNSFAVAAQAAQQRSQLPTVGASATGDHVTWCNNYKLRLQYFSAGIDPKTIEIEVGDFLYDPTKPNYGGRVLRWHEPTAGAGVEAAQDDWRWAHLPVKNDTVGLLSGMSGTELEMYTQAMRAFISKSFHEIKGQASHAILRRPLFTPFPESHGGMFALVNPRCKRFKQAHAGENCQISGQNNLSVHIPLTLDQSYYLSLKDTTNRNEDQVVVKYVERQERGDNEKGSPPRSKSILMVNQLWIWKIDAQTVVTALADRLHPDAEKRLAPTLSNTMQQDPPPSLDMMIVQIIKAATNFVDAPANAGLSENLFDIFEQSIAHWAEKEASCFQAFHQRQPKTPTDVNRPEAARHARKPQDPSEDENLCDISLEVDYLREVMDIKDELKMMERVLVDQDTVLSQYEASQRQTPSAAMGQDAISSLRQSVKFRIAKIHKLVRDASTVENSTPVSFVCAFLAVPTLEFPRNSGAGGIAWRWWQVLFGAFATEVATVMVILAYWAAQKNINVMSGLYERLARAMEKIEDEESR